ncbi:hypothetical protein ACLOJK_028212 [Asimina triloba]
MEKTTSRWVLWIDLDQALKDAVGYAHHNIQLLGINEQSFLFNEPSVEEIKFEMRLARARYYTQPSPLAAFTEEDLTLHRKGSSTFESEGVVEGVSRGGDSNSPRTDMEMDPPTHVEDVGGDVEEEVGGGHGPLGDIAMETFGSQQRQGSLGFFNLPVPSGSELRRMT